MVKGLPVNGVTDNKLYDNKLGETNRVDVMVVGGGISGIQAALDLANTGFMVYLVDRAPAIGGTMSQLDKTFPTNDCSMCIESPKFIECSRHPNIEILSYTEVEGIKGCAGDFRVTLTRRPRYIIEEKCTGCGACVEVCPVKIPDGFNQNLSLNKSIHIYFSQAVPLITYVDPKTCLYLQDEKCNICIGACQNEAIDLNQKEESVEVAVGAVILSAGFEVFDPKLRNDFGYGMMENVVTSLDFERMLSSTGPYEGKILRPSDRSHPRKIAWIQCVGSRQVIEGGNSYCSGVCCAYTQKQVILAKDHDPNLEATIFHNDVRAFGKDFERFYQRAEQLPGVEFIRSYVSMGQEDPETKTVSIRYATAQEGVKEEAFDLVVLAVGLNPPKQAEQLAQRFGIELNPYGFCKSNPLNPLETTRPGVFVSGAFQGPMDIPESVMGASGAHALCSQLLSYRRGDLARDRVYPPERDVTGEAPRVGVFVCHCGANIGRVVDVPAVVEYAATLDHVVHAQESLFACSTDNARQISDQIRDKGLNRVVVAACTPRTHEPLFRDTCREGGINQYFYEMANIREHCSWVHAKDPSRATQKAKEIVRMSVARTSLLEPLAEFDLPVNKTALVVGGGVAGMTCALSMAHQGFEVQLLEKESKLGGVAQKLHTTLEGMDVQSFLKETVKQVYQHPGIHVSHDAAITDVSGYVGNFTTTVTTRGRIKKIDHGAAVLATGAKEYHPTEYLYGEHPNVVTQLGLEERIAQGDDILKTAETVVMIQCVGCRNEERNYCSRICCSHALKNALGLKDINPEMEIYILFRDMRSYGFREDYYRAAADRGVKFIRWESNENPEVEAATENGKSILRVRVADPILGQRLELDADLLALSAAVVPSAQSMEVARLFKVATTPDDFFQEAHVKLRPVDFAAEGVFLCGLAHYPKHITETISQAYGAAGRAITILNRDSVTASGAVCEVDEAACESCGACISVCNYGAIEFHDPENGQKENGHGKNGQKAWVNPILCKGDGLCNTVCPAQAIRLKHYTDDEIFCQIDAS